MTKLRVLFNNLGALKTEQVFPWVKSLGLKAISIFGHLGGRLPAHFERAALEFEDVIINLYHNPTYRNEANWRARLRREGEKTVADLAQLGLNNYAWMIECNLYGMRLNPLVERYVHRDKLFEHFNAFYEVAHDVNPNANVIVVPYPHPLMNLNCGRRGWKDWWVKHGERMRFDQVALNAHVGVWIHALTKKWVYDRLVDSIKFLRERGYPVLYVEVGYPTTGYKPLIGWFGWGRDRDQVDMLDTCYGAISDMEVPYMQICEFIDPADRPYEPFFGDEGRAPKFLGFIPVREEKHWGLLRSDGSEKMACAWVRRITGIKTD